MDCPRSESRRVRLDLGGWRVAIRLCIRGCSGVWGGYTATALDCDYVGSGAHYTRDARCGPRGIPRTGCMGHRCGCLVSDGWRGVPNAIEICDSNTSWYTRVLSRAAARGDTAL